MVKVERILPPPASLAIESQKTHGSYACRDVVVTLYMMFNGKCYICEMGDIPDPQVEHLLPHHNRQIPERVFDWNNLFYACPHCNELKNKSTYEEKILDCCKVDPEVYIYFGMTESNDNVDVRPKNDEEQSKSTAELVQETFNRGNTGIREIASSVRIRRLKEDMNILYKELNNYTSKTGAEKTFSRYALKVLLARRSQFAAFKRCYVREHIEEYPELQEFLE